MRYSLVTSLLWYSKDEMINDAFNYDTKTNPYLKVIGLKPNHQEFNHFICDKLIIRTEDQHYE